MEGSLLGIVLTTLVGVFLGKTLKRAWVRYQDETDFARDALVDIASTLVGVETALGMVLKETVPESYDGLPKFCARYAVHATTIPIVKMLETFNDEELHRNLMLLDDAFRRIDAVGEERSAAYFWLLDQGPGAWPTTPGCERQTHLIRSKENLILYLRTAAEYGYRVLERLYTNHLERRSLLRVDPDTTKRFVRREHGLDRDSVRLRRAYYSMLDVPAAFDRDKLYLPISWDDGLSRELEEKRPKGAVLWLTIDGLPNQIGLWPGVEGALPTGVTINAAQLKLVDGPAAPVDICLHEFHVTIAGKHFEPTMRSLRLLQGR